MVSFVPPAFIRFEGRDFFPVGEVRCVLKTGVLCQHYEAKWVDGDRVRYAEIAFADGGAVFRV